MMQSLAAFMRGLREFRLSCTTSPRDDLVESYDWGREVAHRVTLRRFES